MLKFSSEIFIIGVNPYVPVPEDVLQSLFAQSGKMSGPIPVKGKINDKVFTQTAVKYQGVWRLYLNGNMRKAAGIDVGDTANIEIMFNLHPKGEMMPEKFAQALRENKQANDAYEILAPYRKKEILRYLNSMKTDESLDKNITNIIKHLLGEKAETLHALMRVKRST